MIQFGTLEIPEVQDLCAISGAVSVPYVPS